MKSREVRPAGSRRAHPALLLLAGVLWLPAVAADLIGQVTPPYPDGLTSDSGVCVPYEGEVCGFSVAILADANGMRRYVVASRQVDSGAQPTSRIVDALAYPSLAKGEDLLIADCQRNQVGDPGIVAVVKQTPDAEWFEVIRRAWQLDPRTGRLEPIDPKSVRCYNLGYDLT